MPCAEVCVCVSARKRWGECWLQYLHPTEIEMKEMEIMRGKEREIEIETIDRRVHAPKGWFLHVSAAGKLFAPISRQGNCSAAAAATTKSQQSAAAMQQQQQLTNKQVFHRLTDNCGWRRRAAAEKPPKSPSQQHVSLALFLWLRVFYAN